MINRSNWKHVQAYLQFRREVDLILPNSQRLEETWLRHLLEWANEKSFEQVHKIRPTFPEYILTARIGAENIKLSPVYVRHVVRSARHFFRWLSKHRKGFSAITEGWLDTVKPPRMTIEPTEHEYVTIEEVRAIASASARSTKERRIRAAAVFWFLSGIRISAFVSLPLLAVNVGERLVKQFPKLGVRTKFGKHATTALLDIPDLLKVVQDWDDEVRAALPPKGFWFAHISHETGEIDAQPSRVGIHRHIIARKDLQAFLSDSGLPYHSPHKFRHGNAVYSLKLAKDIHDLKAISQNLMHANISVTDGVYGVLSDRDVIKRIGSLGKDE
jgi:site-specific recombinase XerD